MIVLCRHRVAAVLRGRIPPGKIGLVELQKRIRNELGVELFWLWPKAYDDVRMKTDDVPRTDEGQTRLGGEDRVVVELDGDVRKRLRARSVALRGREGGREPSPHPRYE